MAEESTEEADRPLRELQEELSELNSLRNHRGYQKLMFIAEEQVKARIQTLILKPLKKHSEVLEQEYEKGSVAGIKLIQAMTDAQIGLLETEIQQLLEKEQSNDTSTTDDETTGPG